MIFRIFMAFLCFCAAGRAAETVGLLSLVSGEVQILRAGQNSPVPARTADLIGVGDRVLTGGNSEAAFLFCPESRAGKILADSEVQFEAATLQVRKGKLGEERKIPSCRLPANLALAGASQLQSGMLRLRGSNLLLLAPSHTSIAVLQPRFRWEPVDHATAYDVKLMDREERILWRQSVSGTEVQYPADVYTLEWGQKYWWRVTAREGEETLTEAGSYFQVLSREQADQVRAAEASLRRMSQENPSDNGPLFLLAFLYEGNEMLDEAARVYGELAQRMGPQDWVQGRLTELMNKLGWVRLESGPIR
ncbi:MAG: hypothetical protein HY647_12255 [Acidobacteria bacterium]|nr:hypothetical protein [Acidobacteriota bacterium]